MITIDQLLESVDLDFEPRFVTKDKEGEIWIWNDKPNKIGNLWNMSGMPRSCYGLYITNILKLAEFENKDWTECIYEVPRKTTGKIEKLKYATVSKCGDVLSLTSTVNGFNVVIDKLNTVIDAVNELKGAKNE